MYFDQFQFEKYNIKLSLQPSHCIILYESYRLFQLAYINIVRRINPGRTEWPCIYVLYFVYILLYFIHILLRYPYEVSCLYVYIYICGIVANFHNLDPMHNASTENPSDVSQWENYGTECERKA